MSTLVHALAGCLLLQAGRVFASDFASGAVAGQITNRSLTDISGIVASRKNPGVLWVHNDLSRPHIHAVSTNGQLLASWSLGQPVSDLEDIAIGPGPQSELEYLYCGDIGDNASVRPAVRVYRAAEPAAYAHQSAKPLARTFPLVEGFNLTYPDGSHNAEELMVDPTTGDLFIATKESNRSRVYRAGRAQLTNGASVTLTLAGDIVFDIVSAGDILFDGSEIILRQEEFAKVWPRAASQTIAEALTGVAKPAPVIGTPLEPNGEGVCFAGDGLGYYTISEGANPVLYFFARTNGSMPRLSQAIIPPGSDWKYWDAGESVGLGWRLSDFSDSNWPVGPAPLGYGEGDERTVLSFGASANQKRATTNFRKQFVVENGATVQALALSVVFDDGLAVYLNGMEVLRRNLVPNAGFSDLALAPLLATENVWQSFAITNVLRSGTNTIAVELHRASLTEGDISFDLQLLASPPRESPAFVTPPKRSGSNWKVDYKALDGFVSVERSIDLEHWTFMETLLPTNGSGSFTFRSELVPTGFYRLRQ